MSPRETLIAETREWLERARADLDACAALIAAGLAAEALFHAQQCAEKAMKAVLTRLPPEPALNWKELSVSRSTPGGSAIPAPRILQNRKRREKRDTRLPGFWMP